MSAYDSSSHTVTYPRCMHATSVSLTLIFLPKKKIWAPLETCLRCFELTRKEFFLQAYEWETAFEARTCCPTFVEFAEKKNAKVSKVFFFQFLSGSSSLLPILISTYVSDNTKFYRNKAGHPKKNKKKRPEIIPIVLSPCTCNEPPPPQMRKTSERKWRDWIWFSRLKMCGLRNVRAVYAC